MGSSPHSRADVLQHRPMKYLNPRLNHENLALGVFFFFFFRHGNSEKFIFPRQTVLGCLSAITYKEADHSLSFTAEPQLLILVHLEHTVLMLYTSLGTAACHWRLGRRAALRP